jgi:hypothetical protein
MGEEKKRKEKKRKEKKRKEKKKKGSLSLSASERIIIFRVRIRVGIK